MQSFLSMIYFRNEPKFCICAERVLNKTQHTLIAQWLEHRTYKPEVDSSNLSQRTISC